MAGVLVRRARSPEKLGDLWRHQRSARLAAIAGLLVAAACTEPNPHLGACGDGVVQAELGEECEPSLDAACTEACRLPACGDGLVQEDEACDLGNENGESAACTPLCQLARCGDGFVQADVEACDDGDLGNKASYDGLGGCSTQCTLLPTCGDSVVEAPYEDCDDGNTEDGDGCSHLCQKAVCGDGVLDGGEACDDGNKSNDDACLADCTVATCGDGFVHVGTEECDDGNESNNDACLDVCIAATCGDGLINEGVEECDDGNDVPDDGCDNACIRDRLVFVTEESFSPKSFDGLAGADLACVQIAVAHKLPNPASYKAWLSDAGKSPATRFHHSPGRYVLVTGDVIAASWDDLTDGELTHAIDHTADGKALQETPVWTSTQPNGERWPDGVHCNGWTSKSVDEAGRIGSCAFTDAAWTSTGNDVICAATASLYCFEQ